MGDAPRPLRAGTIVIPAWEEEARIVAAVRAARAWSSGEAGAAEVIVVDDGSRDRTAELAEGAGARVIRLPQNRGKGAAVRAGVLAAAGDPVLFADADLSTPIEAWAALRARHADGADVVIGVRTRESVSERQPLYRILLGKSGLVFAELLLGHGASDTQCGFKSFRADAARRIFSRLTVERFGFDMEVLVIARRLGLRIDEVAVPWAHDARSRVRAGRDALRTLGEVLAIWWRRRRGRYDASAGPGGRAHST
jgi:glycosyltransferase involved in cell wall biosynthesis